MRAIGKFYFIINLGSSYVVTNYYVIYVTISIFSFTQKYNVISHIYKVSNINVRNKESCSLITFIDFFLIQTSLLKHVVLFTYYYLT